MFADCRRQRYWSEITVNRDRRINFRHWQNICPLPEIRHVSFTNRRIEDATNRFIQKSSKITQEPVRYAIWTRCLMDVDFLQFHQHCIWIDDELLYPPLSLYINVEFFFLLKMVHSDNVILRTLAGCSRDSVVALLDKYSPIARMTLWKALKGKCVPVLVLKLLEDLHTHTGAKVTGLAILSPQNVPFR